MEYNLEKVVTNKISLTAFGIKYYQLKDQVNTTRFGGLKVFAEKHFLLKKWS